MINQSKRLAAAALMAAVALGACTATGTTTTAAPPSGASPDASAPAAGSDAPTAVSGSIAVSGSSTVEPISTGVAELLKEANPEFNYTVEGPGTGDGFKRFCAGETDISDASRKIKAEGEADVCAANGIEYVELQIAYDGITVMTSPENSAIECLSFADLYSLIGPESTGFTTWNAAQALATELGSTVSYPSASLDITGPGEESGTFDSFVELVIKPTADARGQDATTRPDYVASANDNTIIEGISGSASSLGWVGFAFAEENKDKVKEISIAKEPGGECIAPSTETISDGSYPIARSLYIYVNKAKAAANPAIGAYVDYYLADGTIATVLETVPYVNLPADALTATRSAWEAGR
ncbi:MAG TPA: substrate-binding domain-containing protein [Candidatus Limnocylindrales bacterium]|nr:substrate-binding domain-containing protein [Candidatus Limnocylindrales bacterium]